MYEWHRAKIYWDRLSNLAQGNIYWDRLSNLSYDVASIV